MRCLSFILLFICSCTLAHGQMSLDVSGGLARQTYNKIQVPNKEGTAFDLYNNFNIETPVISYNLKLGYCIKQKNHIFLLYAPLSINYTGIAPFDVKFLNSTYPEGQNVDTHYKQNSYRITFRRDFYSSERWIVGIGLTAKFRETEIRLANSMKTEKLEYFGFIPLWNLYTEYNINKWALFFEGEGMASGSRRAFDLHLGGKIPLNEHLRIKVEYRMVEGGTDVKSVYNLTMLHFANLGLIINF
ncbi:hypothetical protein [Alkalitalea saponilacus]|uniref:Outer membrane protein beta-barrel domain-containing protein n=1 Tax=Alkalitalea saponilacus TaxID=889453 RepID=A0A1T5DZT7_9BACT|nr:hypothetical protein [Alkalitalea saponilacus]ASB49137.1 hypothetical protein CDL62_08280 [Alkalitalea saponilacus]SKB77302.1 hypothetical protein SAMN03080601_01176 [Alkalitalea saponilacus]